MTQVALPQVDVAAGSWIPSGAGSLSSQIDEAVANDADFIYSSNSPSVADISEVKLGTISDPGVDTGHIVRYRYKKSATGGDSIDLTVRLMQGGTEIASWTHSNIDAVTTAAQTLTSGQAAAITDYSNLRLRFEARITTTTSADYRSSSSAATAPGTPASSLAIPVPVGTQAGDILVAAVNARSSISSIPSGWSVVDPAQTEWFYTGTAYVAGGFGQVFYKVATGSEPASYTWGVSAATDISGIMLALQNIGATQPINAHLAWTSGQSQTLSAPLTSLSPNNLQAPGVLVEVVMSTNDTVFSAPAGITKRVEVKTGSNNNVGVTIAAGTKTLPTGSTPTGTQTWTDTNPNGLPAEGLIGFVIVVGVPGIAPTNSYEGLTGWTFSDTYSDYPTYSEGRLVTVASKSALQTAINNALAGDHIQGRGFSVASTTSAAGLDIRNKSWSSPIWVDLGTGSDRVTFTGAPSGAYPCMYVINVTNLYITGGDWSNANSNGQGISCYQLTHFRLWDAYIHDCGGHGFFPSGTTGQTQLDVRINGGNCGLGYLTGADPHTEKGTGVHFVYIGGNNTDSPYRVYGRIAVDCDHQKYGACIQFARVNSLEMYVRANYIGYGPNGSTFQSTSRHGSGNVLQVWQSDPSGYSLQFDVKYIEAHNCIGRPLECGGLSGSQIPSGLSDSYIRYGRADNCNQGSLNSGTSYWDTSAGINLVDVIPAT